MTNEPGKHAAKQAKRKEIDPSTLKVEFASAPESILYDLAQTVRYSRDFDGDSTVGAIDSLRSLASGQMNAQHALLVIADISEGIQRHTAATHDDGAKNAWRDFLVELSKSSPDKPPFKFVEAEKTKGRG